MMSFWFVQILLVAVFAAHFEAREQPSGLEARPSLKLCRADFRERWSYSVLNGPIAWFILFPEQCNGTQQSPIAINSNEVERDENLAKLQLNNYEMPVTRFNIMNNGHTVEVHPDDGLERTISVNGDDTYRLAQFHFHWGKNNRTGSEHTLDGVQYAMEVHFVHLNSEDKIAVVGVFFEEQENDNKELQKLVEKLPKLKYKGNGLTVESSDLDLNKLLPENPTSFYRYDGSLTTPDCDEGVTWSVAQKPIPVGTAQMKEFRNLFSTDEKDATKFCKLDNNYRPVQNLNGRKVYASQ